MSQNLSSAAVMIGALRVKSASSWLYFLCLRCVDEDLRPFALGVSWMLLRLLGK